MRLLAGNAQHLGARDEQQDSFGFSSFEDTAFIQHGGVIAVLADGMGGMANGREASQIAVASFLQSYESKTPEIAISTALGCALQHANAAVITMARAAGVHGQCGSTLAAVAITGGEVNIISCGDTRIYLCRNNTCQVLTRDHTVGNQLDARVANDELTREEAEAHTNRHALTSFLGDGELNEICGLQEPLRLQPGDRVVLASDGVYGGIDERSLAELAAGDMQDAASEILRSVMEQARPKQDNATVLVLAPDDGTAGMSGPYPRQARKRVQRPLASGAMALAFFAFLAGGALMYLLLSQTGDRATPVQEPKAEPLIVKAPDSEPGHKLAPEPTPAKEPTAPATTGPDVSPKPTKEATAPNAETESPHSEEPATSTTTEPGGSPPELATEPPEPNPESGPRDETERDDGEDRVSMPGEQPSLLTPTQKSSGQSD